MKIELRKSDGLDDWYTIERAVLFGRISNADIEGSAEEMLALARAIKARGSASFKRCAVLCGLRFAYFCSPRNSTRDASVSLEDADEFADRVIAALGDEMEDGRGV